MRSRPSYTSGPCLQTDGEEKRVAETNTQRQRLEPTEHEEGLDILTILPGSLTNPLYQAPWFSTFLMQKSFNTVPNDPQLDNYVYCYYSQL